MCNYEWKSIETAPKDSGYLLLRGGREQDVASGYWLQAAYAGNGAWREDGEADKDELHDALAARAAKEGAKYG